MQIVFKAALLMAAAISALTQLPASAQDRTISECSEKLTARGFKVTNQDVIDDKLFEGVYEYDAVKGSENWKFKMDEKCNILYEHRKY